MSKTSNDPSGIRKKIYYYCAYQERCHQEVRNKLFTFGLSYQEVDELTTHLITEGYLNEERFAKLFAGGKFRQQKWGRVKIVQALEGKGLTKNCIRLGLKEIDEDEYLQTITALVEKKANQVSQENLFVTRDQVARYLIQKGFEADLVWPVVKDKIKG